MSPSSPASPRDTDAEVAALIGALLDTDRRMNPRRGGGVEIAAGDGGAFFPGSARRRLRNREATTQAALIDSLPANIALLDARGVVIAVNAAWRQFAADRGLRDSGYGVGANYPTIRDRTQGADVGVASQVSGGIRNVLSGSADFFSIEYPCHAASTQAWFLLTVTPFDGGHGNRGAVVMHLDITGRKLGEESSRRFAVAMDAMEDAVFLVDRTSMSIVYVNDAACRLQAQTRHELLAAEPWVLASTSRTALEKTYDDLIAGVGNVNVVEVERRRPNGSQVWLEVRRQAQRAGDLATVVTLVRDITQRKEAQIGIAHLHRVYAMLAGINTLIVRVRDATSCFAALPVAVDEGGFAMSWIGSVDRQLARVVPVASAGLDPEFSAVIEAGLALHDEPRAGESLISRAVREKRHVVANDLHNDSKMIPGGRQVLRASRSVAILPLIVAGEVVGVLFLCAREPGFFHTGEMQLLAALSGDISCAIDHLEKQRRLDYLACYDVLTGLANRRLFLERVAQYLRSATGKHKSGLILIDLEGFKNINDTLGAAAGDALLRQVTQWLLDKVGDASLLTRLEADHFAVVMPYVTEGGNIARLLETTAEQFARHPFRLGEQVLRIAAKVGVAMFPDDGDDTDTLFKNAEAALKKAQESGERLLFYARKMTATVAGRLTLENQMHQALEREEFELYYQPKFCLADGRLTGVEALIRWNDPLTGLVPPGRFIPALEATGLIREVGRWALRTAVQAHSRWHRMSAQELRIAVNVSPRQLSDRRFLLHVREALDAAAHTGKALELEITESLIMQDVDHGVATLHAIRDMGVRIAIDDFGTGFSSLSYLSRLPVDTLKIDPTFVHEMTAGPQGLALVSTIVNLAHSLRLTVVAEGVETEEQARLLRSLQCDEVQGYLFSKPLPAALFEARYLSGPAEGSDPLDGRLCCAAAETFSRLPHCP